MKTVQTLIEDLKFKFQMGTATALDNQIGKLSKKEMELFVEANNKGIEGEDALTYVFTA